MYWWLSADKLFASLQSYQRCCGAWWCVLHWNGKGMREQQCFLWFLPSLLYWPSPSCWSWRDSQLSYMHSVYTGKNMLQVCFHYRLGCFMCLCEFPSFSCYFSLVIKVTPVSAEKLLVSSSWFWPTDIFRGTLVTSQKKGFSMNCSQMHSVPFVLHMIISHGSGADQALIPFLWKNIFFHVGFFSFLLLQGGISKQVLQWIRLQAKPLLFLINDQCTTCDMTDQTLHINNSYVNHCAVAKLFFCLSNIFFIVC